MNAQVVTPVPAATIVLLRPTASGFEMFMIVRHHQIDFASGALVFPGGKIDAGDSDPALAHLCHGVDADPATQAIQIGAIREAFEECGVLLARPAGHTDLVTGTRLSELDHYRDEIHGGELTLAAFLTRESLRLACDQLVPFAHWVTPDMMAKRFDTHFFLAMAPADHVAVHDGHESVDSVWISPQQAADDAKAGTRTIIFPTLRNIARLAFSATADAAMARARSATIVTVTPWMDKRDDGTYLCIPADAGYDISEEKMPERPSG
ncbi:MAG: NUDIX hydrolase [Gammaproteobacteria bacterium]|nr:MAG: NUDIX hydrolase [Gammaproteobacteria bacterium]